MNNINILLAMTPEGAELIIKALRAATPLPDANVDGFVAALWNQYQSQMKAAMEAAKAPAATTPSPEDAKAASAPSEPVPATANQGE